VLKAGYTILYEPASWVWHYHRATNQKLDKQLLSYSTGHTAYNLVTFLEDHDARGLVRICAVQPKYFLRHLWQRLRGSRHRSLRTILLEIRGYACGPVALWRSLRRVRELGRSAPYVPPALRTPLAPPPAAPNLTAVENR
jgi:GT2 family glycosyltransferase